MASVLGIDLGTTNSVVCVSDGRDVRVLPDEDGNLLIPSVVSFHPAGDVLVGHPARERRLLDARNTVYSVKRLIGRPFNSPEVGRARERFAFELAEGATQGVLVKARGETYTLPEISAFVLREVRRIAERGVGEVCTQAVITVPANFNELQRSATKAAGRVAGLDVLRILNEPTAAALAYGYGRGSRERIAIFDLGGGTFDITILELAGDVFEVLSTAGDTFLGGDDIDVLITEKMADAFLAHHRFDPRADPQAYERLRAAAEWAKCQLSAEEEVKLRVEELAYGEGGASLDLSFGMTRGALENLAKPLVERAFEVCEDAMKVAGVRPTQLDNIILVGGSTRIPLVRRMVADYFGRQPLDSIDPDLVVAQGAALQAAALAPEKPEPTVTSATQLAKVNLKKVSKAELDASRRRDELKKEAELSKPAQPAFQPPKAIPPPPSWALDAAGRTKIATAHGVREMLPIDNAATQTTASSYQAHDGIAPPPPGATPDAQPYQPSEVSVLLAVPPMIQEMDSEEELLSLDDLQMDAPPLRPRVPVGGQTLGFGSTGLPAVKDDGAQELSQPMMLDEFPDLPDLEELSDLQIDVAPMSAPTPPPPPGPSPPPPIAPPQMPVPNFGAPNFGAPNMAPPMPAPYMPAPNLAAPMGPPMAARTQPLALPLGPPGSAAAAAPLLLDVTPLTLGIETVGGFCEGVIERNAAIPVEQTRIFSTGQDLQTVVAVRIFQGESQRFAENQSLGEIELTGLRQATRGAVTIAVTFMMDADGVLGVRALDKETGKQQAVRINLLGGVGEDEIRRMQERQARMVSG